MQFPLSLMLLAAFISPSTPLQPKSNDHSYRCGQRPINALGVITAGQSAWPGQFPWHAALYRTQQLTSTYICGGFLVSDRMTITAAHCVTAENGFRLGANAVSVRLGVHELLTMVRNTQEHRVERIYRHENYSASSYRHDVAVLLLETVVEFNDYVQPICLWRSEDYGEGDGLSGFVSGWGLTEYDMLVNTLKSARMPMVGYLDCLERDRVIFSQVVFDGMFCAGWKNGTNVCNGDSGGAFAVNVNGSWIARGIVSFTGLRDSSVTLCNPSSFAGFVNVPRYVGWIEKVANIDRFVAVESSADSGTSDEKNSPTNSAQIPSEPTERISRKKCAEYRNGSEGMSQDLSYLAFVAKDTPFMRVIDCFAVLISERFLISTADCRALPNPSGTRQSAAKQFIIIETEGHTLRYKIGNFHQHPEFARSPTENNLALIELERNVSIPSHQFVCLWSSSISEEEFDLGKIILYSAMDEARRPLMDSAKCFDQLLAPSIMVPEEGLLQLAGLVVNSTCSRIRFIKLQKFVPWIERVVWSGA